jgi:hypothetical protein
MPPIPKAIVKAGYKPQSIDTSVDADVLMFNLLRRLSCEDKAQRVQKIDRAIRQISPTKSVIEDPISLAIRVSTRLDSIQVSYYIGGSLASSLWGEPRYSKDLDLVIEISSEQTGVLLAAFSQEFYVSESAVEEALSDRSSSFNIISLDSAEKADLFISRGDRFSRSKMARRVFYPTSGGQLWITSAEDIILQKSVGQKNSDSEKQWRDVLGVLKLQGERLDFGYLERWAQSLHLSEDLITALQQAGL